MSEWVTVGRVDELGEDALMAAVGRVEGEDVVVGSRQRRVSRAWRDLHA